tara:strand:+ start:15562 stop:16623 length:1062 start_codon:yes stop_codon:yes gene_type:complete
MQKGIHLNELASKIQNQAKAKRDFIADTECVRIKADGETMVINGGEVDDLSFKLTKTAHRQIGRETGIPATYYDKLKEKSPSLLAQNVNWWLHSEPTKQMIRTFDFESQGIEDTNRVRAFLGKKYRPLDNVDLINSVLPLITEKGAEVKSCNVTETNLYLHACFPDTEFEISEGDIVRTGCMIRNSEVGLGALKVQMWIERLKCMNGLIVPDAGVRKYHVGKNLASGELAYELMSDETKKKTDKAFWSQVKDVVKATVEEAKFKQVLEQYAEKAKIEVAEPTKAVEVTSSLYNLTADEGKSMLQHLCEGGDYTTWGIANSVTRMAHDEKNYDRAVELEEIGGSIMELNQSDWE